MLARIVNAAYFGVATKGQAFRQTGCRVSFLFGLNSLAIKMIVNFDIPDTERDLYFRLSSSLQLCSPLQSSGYKIAGLYSIHHQGACRYVGQSQNLPSRLANHLIGAYSYADEFRVYFVCEYGFEDFYDRDSGSRKGILEGNELRLIQCLRPIDNIVSDYDEVIPDERLFEFFEDDEAHSNLTGFRDEFSLTIFDEGAALSISHIHDRALDDYHAVIREIASVL